MGKIKKILCMLFVITVVIAPCSLLGNVFAQTGNSVPLTVEVTTDKSSYTAYGIAEITVNITNTSNETVNNISAEAVFNDLSPVGKNNETSKEIESLKSGESFSFSYKATVNASKVKLNFFEKIILWFVRLFNGGYSVTGNNFDDGRKNIEHTSILKFGKKDVENMIVVCYKKEILNNEFETFQSIRKSIENLSYKEEVINILENEIKKGNVIDYQVCENYITFETVFGIKGIWEDKTFFNNENKSVSLNGKTNKVRKTPSGNSYKEIINQVSSSSINSSIGDVAVIRPYRSTDFKYDDFLTTGEIIADAIGVDIDVFDNANATLSVLKNLDDYGIILIDSHGTLILDQTYICLTESYNAEEIPLSDLDSIFVNQHNQIRVNSNFFEENYIDNTFGDCLVFLGTCYSMHDTSFADTLIEKGVDCIYGYTNPVSVIYCNNTLVESMLENLLLDYDNSSVAFSETVSVCGKTDPYNSETDFVTQQSRDFFISSTAHAIGIVKDKSTNNNISGVKVNAIIPGSGSTVPVATTTTDENGDFSLLLPNGTYALIFTHDDYENYGWQVTIENNDVNLSKPVLLTRKTSTLSGTISGTVKDETTGNVISRVNVEVIHNLVDGFDPVITTITDENGLFSVNLPYGIYSLAFSHDNYEYNGITVNVDTENVALTEPVLLTPKDSTGDDENIEFAGGNGTEENPYQVSTPEQLDEVRNYLDCHFIQTADIDLAEWGNWEPIGKVVTKYSTANGSPLKLEELYFTGSYNGNGFSINNLNINDTDISPHYDSFGLFAGINNASIININLINANIHINKSTTDYEQIWLDEKRIYSVCVGGIVGLCYGDKSLISDCVVSGEINVTDCNNAYVGGITGFGNPLNSKNYADIYVLATRYSRYKHEDSKVHCGGITGHSQTVNSKISNCENHGSISATGGIFVYVGGISGIYGQISDCINYGNISGVFVHYGATSTSFENCCVGGINGANTSDYIKNCINYGNISAYDFSDNNEYYSQSGYGVTAGGISGDSTGGNEIISCYNLCDSINANQEHSDVGRIAGTSSKITNCYSSKDTLVNDGIIVSSLHTTDSISKNINGGDLSKEEFLKEENYIDFDFKNIWKIDPEIGGAVLQ